jgi:glycosyltransferase involved in cell wall biosynthesis
VTTPSAPELSVSEPAPRVTVYLPTRNRATRVQAAIESVLAQTLRDFELLVVDDGSTDATPQVLATLANRDARVRVLTMTQSGGAPAARNRAIEQARGEFITGLDDDDLMQPSRLAQLLAAFDDRHAFVCSAFELRGRDWTQTCNVRRVEITLAELLHGNSVGNQVLTRTARLREVGGFDAALVASQDYDLWTRLVQRFGPALRIAEPSYVVTRDEGPVRISTSDAAARGARQYAEKHAALMNSSQRRSQRMIEIIAARRGFSPRDFIDCWTPRNAVSLCMQALRVHVPSLEQRINAARRRPFP